MPLRFSIWPLNQRRFLSLLLYAGGFGLSDPRNTVTHTKLSSITEPPFSLIIKNDGTRTLIFSCDHHDYFRFFLILILIDFCHQKLIVVEVPEQKFMGFYDLGSVFFSYYYCWKLGVRYVLFLENVYVCVFKCNPGLRMRMRLRSED